MVVLGVLSLALPISAILPETVGPDPKNSHQAVLLCTAEAITRCAPRRLTGLERRTFAKSRSQRLATASSDHCLENVRLLRKLYACLVGTTKVVKNTYAAVGTYRCSAPRMADIPMGLCRISSAPASSAAVV